MRNGNGIWQFGGYLFEEGFTASERAKVDLCEVKEMSGNRQREEERRKVKKR